MTRLLSLQHPGPTTQDVATMRRAVRASVEAGGSQVDRDDLELVAAELIANAVVHAPGPIDVAVTHEPDGAITIAVRDSSPTPPGAPADSDEHGRGLMVVNAVARAWGVEPVNDGVGKTVWATLAVNPQRESVNG